MIYTIRSTVLSFTLAFCFLTCTESDQRDPNSILQVYIDDFREEAENRGLNVDSEISNIIAYFDDIDDSIIRGECRRMNSSNNEVVIDRSFWNRSNDRLEREYIVFHELGHCVLDREHFEDRDNQGFCLSIMQSGQNFCIKSYNISNRTALLDELFR